MSDDLLKKRKNTAVICLSSFAGGMELDAVKIANLLCGHADVILIAKKNSFIETVCSDSANLYKFKLELIDFKRHFSSAIIFEVRRLIRTLRIENVIYLGASELRSLYFSFLGFNLNVIVRHGTTKSRPKKDPLHRMIYRCVNYHVAICEHLAQNVKYIIPFAKETRLEVIYSSLRTVPPLTVGYDGSSGKPVTLLHVGRITEGKGQKEAVAACRVLFEQNIPFVLRCVGGMDSQYEEEFRNFCDSVPYRLSIHIIGYTDDVNQYYASSVIFLFPSKGEGLCNAFIEALASGMKCVAFANTSFPELQQLGFPILLAKDQDMEDLQAKLLEAVNSLSRNPVPLIEQAQATQTIFSAAQEREKYLSIMR